MRLVLLICSVAAFITTAGCARSPSECQQHPPFYMQGTAYDCAAQGGDRGR